MSGDESDSRTALLPWIIGLVLFVLLIVAVSYASGGTLFPWMKQTFILNQTAKDDLSNKYETSLLNLEACNKLTQDDCLCEAFPSWPTFQKNTVLEMETRGITTTFTLKYEKEQLRSKKLDDLKLAGKLIKRASNSFVMENLASDPRMIIDWQVVPPYFKLAGDPAPNWLQSNIPLFRRNEKKLVSSFIYKNQGKTYFLTSFESVDAISSFIGNMKVCTA